MWTSGTPRPEGSEVKEHDPNHRPLGLKMVEKVIRPPDPDPSGIRPPDPDPFGV
jgi:hypothetical protein